MTKTFANSRASVRWVPLKRISPHYVAENTLCCVGLCANNNNNIEQVKPSILCEKHSSSSHYCIFGGVCQERKAQQELALGASIPATLASFLVWEQQQQQHTACSCIIADCCILLHGPFVSITVSWEAAVH